MEYRDGFDIIERGLERRREEQAYQLYCHIYPLMTDETFVSFAEFYGSMKESPETVCQSKAEIESNVEQMLNRLTFRKG